MRAIILISLIIPMKQGLRRNALAPVSWDGNYGRNESDKTNKADETHTGQNNTIKAFVLTP